MRPTEVQGEPLSVGISDLIAHRECPRRAGYGAKRHTGEGQQNHALRTPEAGSPATWYGSAIHDVIDAVADGLGDDAAIELAWSKWGAHLDPEDLTLLKEDLEKHHERDFENTRIVMAEDEIRVPLTEMPDGRPIWFRGRIDRLYERLDMPGQFIHVDYKSSKWLKTQAEVDSDPQLWAYNWSLTDFFPEIEDLEQWLDQLRGGMVSTRKSDEQRAEIREWLALAARNYFTEREQDLQADGLPAPRFNQWCPWCSILESCEIVPNLTDWALTRIVELRPPELVQATREEDGASILDETVITPLDEYMDRYDDVKTAIDVLTRFHESAKRLVHELPEQRREQLGFELRGRSNSIISVRARNALYETLGHDRFMELARVTQERLKSVLTDKEQREWALGLVEKAPGNRVVHRTRR